MAGLNGMGPDGLGAKTGRGLGNCNDTNITNENNTLNKQDTITRGLGRGLGRGRMCKRGLGQGLRRGRTQ